MDKDISIIYKNTFLYKITGDNYNRTIIWNIDDIYEHNNGREGILLKEKDGCNFILLDFNIYNYKPVINLIFRPQNLKLDPNNKLCFKFINNTIIELKNNDNQPYNKKKRFYRYYLSKETIKIFTNNILKSIYILTLNNHDKTVFTNEVLKTFDTQHGFESFTAYINIYDEILTNDSIFYSNIPISLADAEIRQEIIHYKESTNVSELNNNEIINNITPHKTNEECYVYLMHDKSNNYYKIGISKAPHYRERTLQSEKPCIEMLCSKQYPNRKLAHALEQALHKTYVNKRIRGEWFNLSTQDVLELKRVLT